MWSSRRGMRSISRYLFPTNPQLALHIATEPFLGGPAGLQVYAEQAFTLRIAWFSGYRLVELRPNFG